MKNSHSSRDLPVPASPTTVTSRARRCSALSSKRLDDLCQLALAADERRLEAGAAPRAARAGDDPQRRPGADRLLAPLDRVLARVLVGDRRLATPAG